VIACENLLQVEVATAQGEVVEFNNTCGVSAGKRGAKRSKPVVFVESREDEVNEHLVSGASDSGRSALLELLEQGLEFLCTPRQHPGEW
jgi:hypothetical protein